jgi:hypothetical protein
VISTDRPAQEPPTTDKVGKTRKTRRTRKSGTSAMTPLTRRLIGAVNVAEAALALLWLVAAYGLTERLVAAQESAADGAIATRTVRWWALDLAVTLNMSLLIVGAAAGAVGSVVHQGMTFAHHARDDSLTCGHIWWYLLRPVWSALLGAVVVVAVNTGLISIGDETTSTAGVTVLVTMGSLAGLFTDQALRRLRPLIGGTSYTRPIMPGARTPVPLETAGSPGE